VKDAHRCRGRQLETGQKENMRKKGRDVSCRRVAFTAVSAKKRSPPLNKEPVITNASSDAPRGAVGNRHKEERTKGEYQASFFFFGKKRDSHRDEIARNRKEMWKSGGGGGSSQRKKPRSLQLKVLSKNQDRPLVQAAWEGRKKRRRDYLAWKKPEPKASRHEKGPFLERECKIWERRWGLSTPIKVIDNENANRIVLTRKTDSRFRRQPSEPESRVFYPFEKRAFLEVRKSAAPQQEGGWLRRDGVLLWGESGGGTGGPSEKNGCRTA